MNALFSILTSTNSKYFTWYKEICQRATTRILPKDVYTEIHHILPKSIYPEYEKDQSNLVKLTAREHFICHWLLTKIIKDHRMIYALQMMTANHTGKRYKLKSSIVYQNLKIKFSLNNQGTKNKAWYTDGTSNKMISQNDVVPQDFVPGRTFSQEHKNSLKGIPKTEEHKQKQSILMKGKPGVFGVLNPASRPEVRAKISKARTGSKASDETKLKMRNSKLGKKRGPTSEETKLKISLAKLRPKTISNAD